METLRAELGAETEAGHSQQLQLQNALSEVTRTPTSTPTPTLILTPTLTLTP